MLGCKNKSTNLYQYDVNKSLYIDVFRSYKMRKELYLIFCCYLIKLVYCHEGPHDQLDVGKLSMSLQIFRLYFYRLVGNNEKSY